MEKKKAPRKPAPKRVKAVKQETIVVEPSSIPEEIAEVEIQNYEYGADADAAGPGSSKEDYSDQQQEEQPEDGIFDDNGTVNQPYWKQVPVVKPKKVGFFKKIANFFKKLFN